MVPDGSSASPGTGPVSTPAANPTGELRKKLADVTKERDAALVQVEKLKGKMENLKTAMKGKTTEIKNLKEKPQGRRAPFVEHK